MFRSWWRSGNPNGPCLGQCEGPRPASAVARTADRDRASSPAALSRLSRQLNEVRAHVLTLTSRLEANGLLTPHENPSAVQASESAPGNTEAAPHSKASPRLLSRSLLLVLLSPLWSQRRGLMALGLLAGVKGAGVDSESEGPL